PLARPSRGSAGRWRGRTPCAAAAGGRGAGRPGGPSGPRRHFRGTLEAVTAEEITLHDPDAGRVAVPLAAIDKAHVDYDFSRPAGPPHARSAREAPCSRT